MSSLQVLPHRQRAFGVWCAQRAWRRGRVAPAHVLVARCRAGVAQGLVQPASAQGGLHLRPLHPAERARFGLRRHRAAAGLLPAHLDAEPSRQAARPARHDAGPVAPAGRRRAHDTAYASRGSNATARDRRSIRHSHTCKPRCGQASLRGSTSRTACPARRSGPSSGCTASPPTPAR